jgi:hypothetical protein
MMIRFVKMPFMMKPCLISHGLRYMQKNGIQDALPEMCAQKAPGLYGRIMITGSYLSGLLY